MRERYHGTTPQGKRVSRSITGTLRITPLPHRRKGSPAFLIRGLPHQGVFSRLPKNQTSPPIKGLEDLQDLMHRQDL